jgi:hypothetical protein
MTLMVRQWTFPAWFAVHYGFLGHQKEMPKDIIPETLVK